MENIQQPLAHDPKKSNQIVDYFKGSIEEIRKVSWPTRRETWRKSWIVIGFSAGFAVFLGALDYVLNIVIEIVL